MSLVGVDVTITMDVRVAVAVEGSVDEGSPAGVRVAIALGVSIRSKQESSVQIGLDTWLSIASHRLHGGRTRRRVGRGWGRGQE
jgi:hypothetical protein